MPGSRAESSGIWEPRGCWLNLQGGWWRLFRHQALAGQSFATPQEITLATRIATCQLNARARPWVWGRPAPSLRHRRHTFTYRIQGGQHEALSSRGTHGAVIAMLVTGSRRFSSAGNSTR